MSYIEEVQLRNIVNVAINPATEDKQDVINFSLQGIKTNQTNTLQVTGLVNAGGVQIEPATETTLALIKNTDGIKKITDELPAGTQLLGKIGIDQTIPGTTNAIYVTNIADGPIITGFATETTLATLLTDTQLRASPITANQGTDPWSVNVKNFDGDVIDPATDGTLASIKDTDGIKKITDALPAGTNLLGKISIDQTTDGTTNKVSVAGVIAHDAVDSGNPIKVGMKAIAHGTNPTAVAAADRTDLYANRAGIPFFIGGHPNIITKNFNVSDADGAQTNADILGAIGTGTKVVVTMLQVMCDKDTTAATQCRIGFGTSTTPALDAAGIIMSHGGIASGSGVVVGNGGGIIGIGGDGEELRVTCEDPTGGSMDITITYYTIES